MANTYKQAYFHLVFAVKNRDVLISKSWKNDLEKYTTKIIQSNGHKLIAIGTMPDHIHIFIGYNLNQTIPDLVEDIKTSTNKWINKNKLSQYKFDWQIGYGAFTHSHSQIDKVAKYVLNQEEHHKIKSYREEYMEILKNLDIKYNEKYLFDFLD